MKLYGEKAKVKVLLIDDEINVAKDLSIVPIYYHH